MADKNFNTVPVSGSINSSDYLHATIGGTHNRVLVSTLIAKAKSETLTAMEASLLDKLTDGCYIFYNAKSGNASFAAAASTWTALQNGGEIANRVLIAQGDRQLVVAPTLSALMSWGSGSTLVATSGNYSTDKAWALAHFDGKARTSAILSSAAYSGDGDGYAPGFCAAYSRTNANGAGLFSGRWWLPSSGELFMICTNIVKINACLALITGSTQISGPMWTSTEQAAGYAWALSAPTGRFIGPYTKDREFYVRPVSAFY